MLLSKTSPAQVQDLAVCSIRQGCVTCRHLWRPSPLYVAVTHSQNRQFPFPFPNGVIHTINMPTLTPIIQIRFGMFVGRTYHLHLRSSTITMGQEGFLVTHLSDTIHSCPIFRKRFNHRIHQCFISPHWILKCMFA
jgi:hypothetical protein